MERPVERPAVFLCRSAREGVEGTFGRVKQHAVFILLVERKLVALVDRAHMAQHRRHAGERRRNGRRDASRRGALYLRERPFGLAQRLKPRFQHRLRGGIGLLQRRVRPVLRRHQGDDIRIGAGMRVDQGEDRIGGGKRDRRHGAGNRTGNCRAAAQFGTAVRSLGHG